MGLAYITSSHSPFLYQHFAVVLPDSLGKERVGTRAFYWPATRGCCLHSLCVQLIILVAWQKTQWWSDPKWLATKCSSAHSFFPSALGATSYPHSRSLQQLLWLGLKFVTLHAKGWQTCGQMVTGTWFPAGGRPSLAGRDHKGRAVHSWGWEQVAGKVPGTTSWRWRYPCKEGQWPGQEPDSDWPIPPGRGTSAARRAGPWNGSPRRWRSCQWTHWVKLKKGGN